MAMAITCADSRRWWQAARIGVLSCVGLLAWAAGAHAQTIPVSVGTAPAATQDGVAPSALAATTLVNNQAAPTVYVPGLLTQTPIIPNRTISVTPTLSLQTLHSDNATGVANNVKQADTIVSVVPGVTINLNDGFTRLNGHLAISDVQYLNHTQSDAVLPNGSLNLHTDVGAQGVGLDASGAIDQVKNSFTTVSTQTPTSANTYTTTRVSVSPFVQRQLSPTTQLSANVRDSFVQSTAEQSSLSARPDINSAGAGLRLEQRAVPLGYGLQGNFQRDSAAGLNGPLYGQVLFKGGPTLALNPEITLGLETGHEQLQTGQDRKSGWVNGASLKWAPTPLLSLTATADHHYYGNTWDVALTQRVKLLAVALTSTRAVTTYAAPLGVASTGGSTSALLDAAYSNLIPDAQARQQAVQALIAQDNLPRQLAANRDLYTLTANITQDDALRLALSSNRVLGMLAVGQVKAKPLNSSNILDLFSNGSVTQERYAQTDLTYRLTPLTNVHLGLRWDIAHANDTLTHTLTRNRDLMWTLGMSMRSSRHLVWTWGLQQDRAFVTTTGHITENVIYAGFDLSF